ncbi:MAG: hypothetical protein K2J20_01835 [Bacilli bacterium]|nr:hypothetical protein [Bacilli bacterium]
MEVTTNKIIDIHNHTLPRVDDGAKTFEEASNNLKYLASCGITDVILTSHYIVNTKYQSEVSKREEILIELKSQNPNINLYLGNELFVTDSETILTLLKENKITTLNSSRYLLIEFPRHQVINHADKIIAELNDHGITPIIAHPERYVDFYKNYNKLKELLEYDCLLQCNLGSISSQFGRHAKKLMKRLLKENLVSFVATDFHHITDKQNLAKQLKKLYKFLGPDKYKQLLYDNPKKVINNEKI